MVIENFVCSSTWDMMAIVSGAARHCMPLNYTALWVVAPPLLEGVAGFEFGGVLPASSNSRHTCTLILVGIAAVPPDPTTSIEVAVLSK